MTPAGPYGSAGEVRSLPAVQAIYDAMHAADRPVMADLGHAMLREAAERAGIELGRYGDDLALWLAGFGPAYPAVFADLITRAFEAGKAAGSA